MNDLEHARHYANDIMVEEGKIEYAYRQAHLHARISHAQSAEDQIFIQREQVVIQQELVAVLGKIYNLLETIAAAVQKDKPPVD